MITRITEKKTIFLWNNITKKYLIRAKKKNQNVIHKLVDVENGYIPQRMGYQEFKRLTSIYRHQGGRGIKPFTLKIFYISRENRCRENNKGACILLRVYRHIFWFCSLTKVNNPFSFKIPLVYCPLTILN